MASLIEKQYMHCIDKKDNVHILRSDGMEKNKNIATKCVQLLQEKYRNHRINSKNGYNYILVDEEHEDQLKLNKHHDEVLMKLRVCFIIYYYILLNIITHY